MKEVRIFVASSMVDLQIERAELLEHFDALNKAHKRSGIRLVWNMPEKDMPDDMRTDGSQAGLDDEIRKCDYCVFIVGAKLGQYTRREFDVAWDSFQKSGKPKILSYFLPPSGKIQTREVGDFVERLKKAEYYYKVCESISDIKVRIDIQLAHDDVFYPKQEAPADTPAPPPPVAAPIEMPAPQAPSVTLADLLEQEQTYLGNIVYYLSRAAGGGADAYQGAAVNFYNLGLVKATRGKLSVAKLYFEQSLLLFNLISQDDDAQDCRNRLAELQKLEDSGAADDSDKEDMEQAEYLSGILSGIEVGSEILSGIEAGSEIATIISGIGELIDVFLDDD